MISHPSTISILGGCPVLAGERSDLGRGGLGGVRRLPASPRLLADERGPGGAGPWVGLAVADAPRVERNAGVRPTALSGGGPGSVAAARPQLVPRAGLGPERSARRGRSRGGSGRAGHGPRLARHGGGLGLHADGAWPPPGRHGFPHLRFPLWPLAGAHAGGGGRPVDGAAVDLPRRPAARGGWRTGLRGAGAATGPGL
jgi:hypothetical protein